MANFQFLIFGTGFLRVEDEKNKLIKICKQNPWTVEDHFTPQNSLFSIQF